MPSSSNQRLKLLYLQKILFENTDEQNPLTIAEIVSALSEYDIKAERKTIYSDIELLREFGIDIEMKRSKSVGYYVAERQFDLPELKLLIDAVQSSFFISNKKSVQLIRKLSSLTSTKQAKQIQRQVFNIERVKTINETVYYSIDQIHNAINENKKITFRYFDYGIDKHRIYRKQGGLYKNTPVSLCFDKNKYYLIAYSVKYDDLSHYRIDRMSNVSISDEKGDEFDKKRLNITEHIKQVFGMHNGELVRAKISFVNSLVNKVIDHFGMDVVIMPSEEGWFDINANVSISPVLLAWLFQFGNLARIKSPDSLINAMCELLDKNLKQYRIT